MSDLPTTQRAYTLRLRGVDPQDHSWRDALWATHEAVNKGAKVFGEWLLTLRGGLDHKLADEPVKEKSGKTRKPTDDERSDAEREVDQAAVATTRAPTADERRDRRILLALSWLSVEDAHGAPDDESLIVCKGTDSADSRVRKLADAFTEILKHRGVDDSEAGDFNKPLEHQPGTWLADCLPSLSSAIREDAVWVNRSRAFDNAAKRCPELTRDEVWDILCPFFASPEAYLLPERSETDEDDTDSDAVQEEKAKDLVQKAGSWLSMRMGVGRGADFEALSRAYIEIANWASSTSPGQSGQQALESLADHLSQQGFSPRANDATRVLSIISGPGYKSATRNHLAQLCERAVVTHDDMTKLAQLAKDDVDASRSKIGGKGQRPYASVIVQDVEAACGFTYLQPNGPARHREFSVMLDHAARRIVIAHSWIKNAEAERRKFESDAKRIEDVPRKALKWLRDYCEERGRESGSLDGYRIRKRAIDGWDKVVAQWSRLLDRSAHDRKEAARRLQDDPEIDKFGDIQLFEALAGDDDVVPDSTIEAVAPILGDDDDVDAMSVWIIDGKADGKPLRDFVAATDADAKKRRFKVPAYRHPHPLRHPVFTDFGNSRWDVEYSVHRAATKCSELRQKVHKLTESVRKLDAATSTRRGDRASRLADEQAKLDAALAALAEFSDPHRVELKLLNGQTVAPVSMKWSSKRLLADFVIQEPTDRFSDTPIGVARADRLGRAAVFASENHPVNIAGLFEQEHWNGRLQAPRAQLDNIARHVERHGWDADARAMIGRIRWLLSFSAELAQQGPWLEYCKQFDAHAPANPFVSRKGDYAVKHRNNDQRNGHAKLILSRLPGLRVLAVDLGHRYAAACAVWEAISSQQLLNACIAAGVDAPSAHAMFLHLKRTKDCGKTVTTIYRRIGTDFLPDGSPHPAPWARLDRQFLIKLPGEDRPPRKASPSEIQAVVDFEDWVGLRSSSNDPQRNRMRRVDLLMNDAVRTARLALARHGRHARIAFNLTAPTRTLPGGRKEELDNDQRVSLLTDSLADWHALAADSRWNDEPARQLWNEKLANLDGGFPIDPPPDPSRTQEEPTRAQRRKADSELRDRLKPLARTLTADEPLRQELHALWAERWNADDTQWMSKLKWLSRWLMPRGGPRRDGARRHVGGLSLLRISTFTDFRRKVQVGYYTRMRPDGRRDEIGQNFGQSTLDAIQRLKEQRIKQLSSRIVEAALGIGIERPRSDDRAKRKRLDVQRPREPLYRIDEHGVECGDPRFQACHAVVIENLKNYRPEETRTRRENRATMDWKSAETRKRLADHCQLYGLHLRDVNPQYTSRQDSRTGSPGCRCIDVPVADFLSSPWWRKRVEKARQNVDSKKGDARDRLLLSLDQKWKDASSPPDHTVSLRLPFKGGELFVSADPASPLAAGIQADLNAAANIGLRALLDPDFPGKWWYVPCNPSTRQPLADKVKGSILESVGPLRTVGDASTTPSQRSRASKGNPDSRKNKQKDVINLWRDPAATPINPSEAGQVWLDHPAYWKNVMDRVVKILQ
jgi:IS605 OrfB family transposase